MKQSETKPYSKPHWNVARIDRLVKRLRSEYSQSGQEDTEEVCALIEFRNLLSKPKLSLVSGP